MTELVSYIERLLVVVMMLLFRYHRRRILIPGILQQKPLGTQKFLYARSAEHVCFCYLNGKEIDKIFSFLEQNIILRKFFEKYES